MNGAFSPKFSVGPQLLNSQEYMTEKRAIEKYISYSANSERQKCLKMMTHLES